MAATAQPGLRSRKRGARLGGTEGNELLTGAAAAVLTLLLLGEGITILSLQSLRTLHMLIGVALIPPVLLKLASTGYRMVNYYLGARAYREKGPPLLPLRLLAPVLVAATVGVLASGVGLMLNKHNSDTLMFLHKGSFIVWGACFAIHFLAHLPRMGRALRRDYVPSPGEARVQGTALRGAATSLALGAGLVLALAVLSIIQAWHGGGGPG